jgi:hypothetical protein
MLPSKNHRGDRNSNNIKAPAHKLGSLADRLGSNTNANQWDERSNVFSCDCYGVFAAHATISIFAETLSICATRVLFASAPSLRAIFEIAFLSHPWHVTGARRCLAI